MYPTTPVADASGDRRRERLLFGDQKLLLHRLAVGDVAHESGEHHRRPAPANRKRELHGKRAAVPVQALVFADFPLRRERPFFDDAEQVLPVGLPVLLGHEHRHGFSEDIPGGVPEHPLRALVEQDDVAVGPDPDDAVGGGPNETVVLRLRLPDLPGDRVRLPGGAPDQAEAPDEDDAEPGEDHRPQQIADPTEVGVERIRVLVDLEDGVHLPVGAPAHGDVDLHQVRILPLVPVLDPFEMVDRRGKRSPEGLLDLLVVRKALSDEPRLVRPGDRHVPVPHLDPLDLGAEVESADLPGYLLVPRPFQRNGEILSLERPVELPLHEGGDHLLRPRLEIFGDGGGHDPPDEQAGSQKCHETQEEIPLEERNRLPPSHGHPRIFPLRPATVFPWRTAAGRPSPPMIGKNRETVKWGRNSPGKIGAPGSGDPGSGFPRRGDFRYPKKRTIREACG